MPSVAPLRSESEFVSEREALHRGKSWIMLAGWDRDILTSWVAWKCSSYFSSRLNL